MAEYERNEQRLQYFQNLDGESYITSRSKRIHRGTIIRHKITSSEASTSHRVAIQACNIHALKTALFNVAGTFFKRIF